mgnify:CR=1 FL=1
MVYFKRNAALPQITAILNFILLDSTGEIFSSSNGFFVDVDITIPFYEVVGTD